MKLFSQKKVQLRLNTTLFCFLCIAIFTLNKTQ
ncbi:MAG: hypothetical protein K0Q79_1732 [Flavipsychrobacter sp.]|jgi:hypothetical protein|nr:hypothetical protein [Flavipsychrobacter sp.]